jgi:hypothetical protein
MIYREPGFLAVSYGLAPPPSSPAIAPWKSPLATDGKTEKEILLADGRRKDEGEGEEPNHTTARKPGAL